MSVSFHRHGTHAATGAFTTVHGHRHGTPNRYEVRDNNNPSGVPVTIGWVYRVELNVVGATYTVWHAEPADLGLGVDLGGKGFPTRRAAAEALQARRVAH